MPGAGSLAKCQCCCVDRLCSRGENRGTAPQLDGAVRHGSCRTAFFTSPRKKPPLNMSGGQTVKEPRGVCACGRKESPIIFFGDMCGEENTSQAASVEFVRRRRTNYARSRLQPPCQKVILFDSLKKPPLISSGGLPYFCSVNWRAAAPRGAQAAAATAAAAKTRPPSPRRCPDAAAACRRRTRANSTRR